MSPVTLFFECIHLSGIAFLAGPLLSSYDTLFSAFNQLFITKCQIDFHAKNNYSSMRKISRYRWYFLYPLWYFHWSYEQMCPKMTCVIPYFISAFWLSVPCLCLLRFHLSGNKWCDQSWHMFPLELYPMRRHKIWRHKPAMTKLGKWTMRKAHSNLTPFFPFPRSALNNELFCAALLQLTVWSH